MRANQHIEELMSIANPLAPDLYAFGWFPNRYLPSGIALNTGRGKPNTNMFELAFYPKKPIGQIMALIIGDAVHNLRTALDYAATAICRQGETSVNFVTFPFHKKRENLKNSTGMREIKEAIPNADVEQFITDTIKPYMDGNTDLWCLNKLDKIDKHNFIIPNVAIANIRMVGNIVDEWNINEGLDLTMSHDLNSPFALIRKAFLANSDIPKYNVDITSEITFPEGEFFSELPVIPTLVNLRKIVDETLISLERFCVASGLYPALAIKR